MYTSELIGATRNVRDVVLEPVWNAGLDLGEVSHSKLPTDRKSVGSLEGFF